MNILLASSEVHPFSKTGGLADMVAALGKYLGESGAQVGLVTPLYRGVLERFESIEQLDLTLKVDLGGRIETATICRLEASEGFTIYFVDHVHFFQRSGIYGENSQDYSDNAQRFLFLSRITLQLMEHLDWAPQLIHVHDWPVAILPALLREQVAEGWLLEAPKTLLTIHNLAYQGVFPVNEFALTNLPGKYFHPDGIEFYGQMNFLKAGIVYADHIGTVSPSYAEEILTAEFGCGLEGVLSGRAPDLTGILNGVDYSEWNTTENCHLDHPFAVGDLAGKAKLKEALQRDLVLPVDSRIPLFGMISRVVEQKGILLLVEALRQALRHPMQFVFLGSGDPELEEALQELGSEFPDQVKIKFGYDSALSHRIEAGCDFYLMPSRFEPCGLNQLYSLRYGTIPIVHGVGGLQDSVSDGNDTKSGPTGFKFADFNSAAFLEAIYRGLRLFEDSEEMARYRRRGMEADFSWRLTVQRYLELYRQILRS